MKIERLDGATTFVRDSDVCIAWACDGEFHIDIQIADPESPGMKVDEATFWRAVALIDPAAAEERKP